MCKKNINRKQKGHTENYEITHNRKYDTIQDCLSFYLSFYLYI